MPAHELRRGADRRGHQCRKGFRIQVESRPLASCDLGCQRRPRVRVRPSIRTDCDAGTLCSPSGVLRRVSRSPGVLRRRTSTLRACARRCLVCSKARPRFAAAFWRMGRRGAAKRCGQHSYITRCIRTDMPCVCIVCALDVCVWTCVLLSHCAKKCHIYYAHTYMQYTMLGEDGNQDDSQSQGIIARCESSSDPSIRSISQPRVPL